MLTVGLLIYDILSRRRAHIPRTQPVVVCMKLGSSWQGTGIIWTIRGRCVSGVAATLGERVASLLEEIRG